MIVAYALLPSAPASRRLAEARAESMLVPGADPYIAELIEQHRQQCAAEHGRTPRNRPARSARAAALA